jgi:hypothetical protein
MAAMTPARIERLTEGQRTALDAQNMRTTELVAICRKISGRKELTSVAQLTPFEASAVLSELGVERKRT